MLQRIFISRTRNAPFMTTTPTLRSSLLLSPHTPYTKKTTRQLVVVIRGLVSGSGSVVATTNKHTTTTNIFTPHHTSNHRFLLPIFVFQHPRTLANGGSETAPEPVRLRLPEDESAISKKITEWYKRDGDAVKQGEALCEVDAGDVVYDFLSPMSGYLVRITALQGSADLKGGEVIAFMASALDHYTSVKFEAAKDVAEGRVIEHGAEKSSQTTATTSSSSSNDVVHDWLQSVSPELIEYETALRKDGYDSLASLATLEEADLDGLGISKKGHRKVLIKAVAELNSKKV